jgi:hypothetical protein
MGTERKPSKNDEAIEKDAEIVRADANEDSIEEALEESFPASDPPSWAPLRSGPPKDCDPEAQPG